MTEHTGECGRHRWCRCACRPGATRWAARCRHRPAAPSGPGLRRRRVGLAWSRLPAAVEVAIIAAGYAGYALVRLAVRASRPAAIAHAARLWRGGRGHLAWLYPAAPTVVVLATANHFLADAAAGLAVTALGLLAARATTRPDATGPGPGGAGPAAASSRAGSGAVSLWFPGGSGDTAVARVP